MAGSIRLCPDGTVPLVVCDTCKALTRAADAQEHQEWHDLLDGRPDEVRTLGGHTLERPPTFGDPGRC